jgi:hypothetical protein
MIAGMPVGAAKGEGLQQGPGAKARQGEDRRDYQMRRAGQAVAAFQASGADFLLVLAQGVVHHREQRKDKGRCQQRGQGVPVLLQRGGNGEQGQNQAVGTAGAM